MASMVLAPIVEQLHKQVAPGKSPSRMTMVENCLLLREIRLQKKHLEAEENRLREIIEATHPEDGVVRLNERFVLAITTIPAQRLNTSRVKAYLKKLGKLKQFEVTGTSRRIEVKEG